jgi:hypothetical protein
MRRGVALLLGIAAGAPAGAGELGYPGSALAEFAGKPRPSFDEAPPVAAGGSQSAPKPPPEPAPAAEPVPAAPPSPTAPAAAEAPLDATFDEYEARCFVKIDGNVVTSKVCRILREKDKSFVFQLAEGALTITHRHGRVWTARLGSRDFGNVYKTGSCWGAHGFYACDRGRR